MRPLFPLVALAVVLAPSVSRAQTPAPVATPAPTAVSGAPKVIVFPFAALGDEARARAELLRRNLINSIDPLKEVDVLDTAAAEAALGKPLLEVRDACADDNLCLEAAAASAKVRYLVKGGLQVDAKGGFTVMLQAFDAETRTTHREPTPHHVAGEAAAVESMKTAANWLFATTGTLLLHTPVSADVFLDSRPLGKRTPADKAVPLTLPVGKTNVRLEAAGFEPFSEVVTIKPGSTTSLKPVLKQKSVAARPGGGATPVKPTPLTRKPLFWGAVAAGVLAVGAGAALATQGAGGGGGGTEEQPGTNDPPQTAINW